MSIARPIAKVIRSNPPKGMREGGVLLLLYSDNKEWHTTLIRRPEYEGVHSAQIALPGGKREEGDLDMSYTALREAWEEVGVPMNQVEILGALSEVYIPPSNFLVSSYVGVVESKPEFVAQESEVAEILEMNIKRDLLDQVPVDFQTKESDRSGGMRGFVLGDHFIWGATAMILNEFRNLMLEDKIEL